MQFLKSGFQRQKNINAMDVSTRESPYATADIAERGDARRSLEETDDRWRREHAVDAPGGYQHARVMAVTGQIERRWRVQRDRALIRRIQNLSPSTTRVWTPQEAHAHDAKPRRRRRTCVIIIDK